MDPKDIELLNAFVVGLPGSRDPLIARWLPVVLQWCARLGGPSVNSEDAAQDAFIVVLTRLESLRDLHRFRSWLFGITRRVVQAHRRRAWVRRWVPGLVIDGATDEGGPRHQAEQGRVGLRVQALLERLPTAQREVLVLVDVEDRSASEAAELLDVPVGTVKSRLRLGRDRLRGLASAEGLHPSLLVDEGAR